MRQNSRHAPVVGKRSPRPTGWETQPLRGQPCAMITHVAPLGLWVTWLPVYYKHAAPLGLNAPKCNTRSHCREKVASPDGLGNPTPTGSTVRHDTTLRSAGARRLDLSTYRSAGAKSWFWVLLHFRASIQRDTCRPAGALGLGLAIAINMTPRWG